MVNPDGVRPDFQDINVKNFHQVNQNGPQIKHEVQVHLEGNSSHQATINFRLSDLGDPPLLWRSVS